MGIVFKGAHRRGYVVLKKGTCCRVAFSLDDDILLSYKEMKLPVRVCRMPSVMSPRQDLREREPYPTGIARLFSFLPSLLEVLLRIIGHPKGYRSLPGTKLTDETEKEEETGEPSKREASACCLFVKNDENNDTTWSEISFRVSATATKYKIIVGDEKTPIKRARVFHVVSRCHNVLSLVLWFLFSFSFIVISIAENFSVTFASAYSLSTAGLLAALLSALKVMGRFFSQIPRDLLPLFGIAMRPLRTFLAALIFFGLLAAAQHYVPTTFAAAIKKKGIREDLTLSQKYSKESVRLQSQSPELLWLWRDADEHDDIVKTMVIETEKDKPDDNTLWYSINDASPGPFSWSVPSIRSLPFKGNWSFPFKGKTIECKNDYRKKLHDYLCPGKCPGKKEEDCRCLELQESDSEMNCFVKDSITLENELARDFIVQRLSEEKNDKGIFSFIETSKCAVENTELTFSNLSKLTKNDFESAHDNREKQLEWHQGLFLLKWSTIGRHDNITFTFNKSADREPKTDPPSPPRPGLTGTVVKVMKGEHEHYSFIPHSEADGPYIEAAFIAKEGVIERQGTLKCQVDRRGHVVSEVSIYKNDEKTWEEKCTSVRFRSYDHRIDTNTELANKQTLSGVTMLCHEAERPIYTKEKRICGDLTCISPEGEPRVLFNTVLHADEKGLRLNVRDICYITNPEAFRSGQRADIETECDGKPGGTPKRKYWRELDRTPKDATCDRRKLKCKDYKYCHPKKRGGN